MNAKHNAIDYFMGDTFTLHFVVEVFISTPSATISHSLNVKLQPEFSCFHLRVPSCISNNLTKCAASQLFKYFLNAKII